MSCDVMSLRQHIWFTGTSFFGYEDVGDGKNPAKHVMMVMVTALNMGWKLPVANFLLPDSFPSQKRAELLRICLYKLNNTGAIITNIVMDNCPVNYATFRWLGCKLSHCYDDLNTCTDIKNALGKCVMALFDPPHLAKLGNFFKIKGFVLYFYL
jgi:hypothetical protein